MKPCRPFRRLAAMLAVASFVSYPVVADDEFITVAPSQPAYPGDGALMHRAIDMGGRPNPGMSVSGAAVTLRRRAENVALTVSLVNDNRQAEARNREVLETLQRLIERAGATPGIRIHNGRIDLSLRDRKLASFGDYDTRTNTTLYVLGELPEDRSALEITNTIKQFLGGVQPVGQTRIVEGSVGLSLREPEKYRRELVTRIVEDVHFVSEKLGGRVKISITGLDRPLTVRQRNDTEVELAIGYSYSIEYQRE